MTFPKEPIDNQDRSIPSNQEATPGQADFPEENSLPDGFTPLIRPPTTPARRRRARRTLILSGDDDRRGLVEDLARWAFPSIEFYLLAFLSGIILGAGYLLDSDALLLLGLLIAPLLAPWVGLILATVTGSLRFFIQTLGFLSVAAVFTFLTSSLVGSFNRVFHLSRFFRAADHTKLWWSDLIIVTIGAVLLSLAFARGNKRPIIFSIMLAYGLFLPISAAGFGFGAGVPDLWPNGVYIFLTHLALATITGCIVFFIMRFRPPRSSGYWLTVGIGLVCLATVLFFTGFINLVLERIESESMDFTPTMLNLVSPTPGLPPSATPGISTPTYTLIPSKMPSSTSTLTSEPRYAIISSDVGGGANLRSEPGGAFIITLINGTVVEILPDIQAIGGVPWIRIRTADGLEGYVLEAILLPTSGPVDFSTQTPIP